MPNSALRAPPFAALIALAWLALVLQLLWGNWAETGTTLGDTDDAMRLAQVRAFLDGQGWFDLHEARVEPPGGYDSHWSRLIDAGLAGLFLFFRMFVDAALAERLMRAVWPLLWLAPTLAGAAAIAWRLAGREAALVLLLLAVAGLPAAQQFKPGRIDHHNVQIALAVLVAAATVWSDRKAWGAAAAGAATGLALAVGLEGLPILLVCGAGFALRYAFTGERQAALRAYGLALAASTGAAFLVSVGPDRWGHPVCDAIAVNSALGVALGGLALAALAHAPWQNSAGMRWAGIAVAAALAFVVFAAIEPRCLRGPFALMDPAVRPLWLDHVREALPWREALRTLPQTAIALAAFPAVAGLAALFLAREAAKRRDFAAALAVAAFAVALATLLGAIKGYAYAAWLGMPLVAAALPALCSTLKLHAPGARAAAALLIAPTVVSVGAVAAAGRAGFADAAEATDDAKCFENASYAAVAKLPPGIVAAATDYGPFLLALTPHSVLAAPYHRLSPGIIAAHAAWARPPEEARRAAVGAGAHYLVTCGSRPPPGLDASERDASLWGRLKAGNVPEWLERIALPMDEPFAVYRVRS